MSNSPPNEAPEARELDLVGKVELRIALTDSDKKLESTLKVYLAPLLLKLASNHLNVRDKVISVCQHINNRIRPPSIKLPVAALLKQYKNCHNGIVRHFDLLYIQQGVDRLPIQERIELLPTLIQGLAEDFQTSVTQTASLFNVLLKLLRHVVLPLRGSSEDLDLREKLGLAERPQDAEFVAAWLAKVLLFTAPGPNSRCCPGLSFADYEFLQVSGKDRVWDPTSPGGLNLAETKIVSARFLSSGAFVEHERFLPALLASADTNSRLSDIAEDMLKRATPVISLEDRKLIQDLYTLYLGVHGEMGSQPVRRPLQTKILALLSKSKEATTFVSEIIQIVRDALEPQGLSHEPAIGAPKLGLEMAKLRSQVFAFANWTARTGSKEDLSALAPTLVTDLRAYVEGQGWPRMNGDTKVLTSGEISSRSYCYESIGLLAKACPEKLLVEPSLGLLRWLFSSLGTDTSGKDISISNEQALSNVLGAFTGEIEAEVRTALTDLLLHSMGQQIGEHDANGNVIVRSTRYTAVRFANRCLPFGNVKARLIDVLALTGGPQERNEVIEEGRRGLDPHWYRNLNPLDSSSNNEDRASGASRYKMPDFSALTGCFFTRHGQKGIKRGANFGSAYSTAIVFCRCVLLHHALSLSSRAPVIDVDWEKNIDAAITNNEDSRKVVSAYLSKLSNNGGEASSMLLVYLRAAFTGLVDVTLVDADRSGKCLLEILSLGPGSLANSIVPRIAELQATILGVRHGPRALASHVFGLLAAMRQSDAPDINEILQLFVRKIDTWKAVVGSQVLEVHGSILATAYWLSRLEYLRDAHHPSDDADLAFVKSVLAILDTSRDKELLDAAILAIDQLSVFGALSQNVIPAPHDVFFIIDKLKERAEAGDEKAVLAMGHLAMQCDEDTSESSALSRLTAALYALHEKRQPELQFAVGSALSCAAVGWQSKSLIGLQDVDRGSLPKSSERSHVLTMMLEKILNDCKTTKPALKQGSVIWLLCIVQYCGHLPELQNRLRSCQTAFKGFLADREPLIQETASRGLTLVYDKGDRSLKDDLIRDLVGSFTGTTAALAGNVSSETQLFDPGALPTGEGSVTTYKDIMSLAAEVGDSSLVYRFMSLASNNAIWSSRAAFGRFGLSSILSDSSVDGYLAQNPKLYPALFRYRCDPNSNVRTAMNDIWSALVKDPTAVIDTYFDSIMEDLLKNILGKEWRVRQASCTALAELVQGRSLEKYEKYLNRIWTLTFKVCDDIKDSVRQAAMALARVLTGVLTRSLEAGDSSKSTTNSMLKEVLPFLLSPSGLESSAREVQAFALRTLLEVIKSSNGKTLRPFIPDVVGRLLGLLSSLEPQEINYIHLNADKYGMTAQQIDDVRLTSVKTSPMMEAIERCLDMLDDVSMKELQPILVQALRTTIGLPSKVGVSRVLVSLSTRHNYIFKPHADSLLSPLRKYVLDRNDTISTSFAVASGYVARLASDGEILGLFEYCRKLYFDSGEEERHRIVSGEIVFATAKHAPDRFASLANDILPFVFIAKHDLVERTKDLFKNTWTENVGGSRAVLLYLKEILAMASPHLDSPRWSIKHTAAFSISDVVRSAGTDISNSDAEMIWPALERAIGGKTWDGKEEILEAFIALAKHSQLLICNPRIADRMKMIILRESKRNNAGYRQHALTQLGEYIEICRAVDWFDDVYEITSPLIQELLNDDHDMDVDSKSGGLSSKITSENTLANALRTLLRSIDPTCRKSSRLRTSLIQTLDLVKRSLTRNDRVVQEAVVKGEKALFTKLTTLDCDSEALDEVLADYVPTLFGGDNRRELTRIEAAEASAVLGACARKGGRVEERLKHAITALLQNDRSPLVRQALDRAGKCLGK